jgi:hypothetical protein
MSVPSVGKIASASPPAFSDLTGFYAMTSGSTWNQGAVAATGHTLTATDKLIYALKPAERVSVPTGVGVPYGWFATVIANTTAAGTGTVVFAPTGGAMINAGTTNVTVSSTGAAYIISTGLDSYTVVSSVSLS